MGFPWSAFFAQNAGFTQLLKSGLKPESAMTDRGPAPVLQLGADPRFYLYIDNAGIVGLEKEGVTARLHDACETLDSCGLVTHEVEVSNVETEMLGWRLGCRRKCTSITSKRYYRLRKTLTWLLALPKVPGWMLEAVVGTMTFAGLARRPVLCILHSVYAFMHAHYHCAVPLWDSVREELEAFRGILPLLRSSWTAQWAELVSSSDAGPSGWGITHSRWSVADVAAVGRVLERSRYQVPGAEKAREHAFGDEGVEGLDEFSAVGLDQPGWVRRTHVPEVPTRLLEETRWKVAKFDTWTFDEDSMKREGRALLYVLKRVCKGRRAVGKRFFF